MSHILITYLSLLNPRLTSDNKIKYTSNLPDNEMIEAVLTNEVAPRYLQRHLSQSGKKLDRIFAVCTDEVLTVELPNFGNITTDTYFKGQFPDIDVRQYTASDNIVKDIMEIMANISKDDKIYLDITGGFRDAVYAIALINRFAEFNGRQVEMVIYAMMDGGRGIIKDFTPTFRIMNLINGMSEFSSFGSTKHLEEYFMDSKNTALTELIDSMRRFTDSITLGKTDNLERNLANLQKGIELFQKSEPDMESEQIMLYMTDLIQNKFFKEQTINYLSVIEWCLENNLVQQALTLYTEKIPKYLFETGIISCTPEFRETIAKQLPKNVEEDYFIFCSDFLTPTGEDDYSKMLDVIHQLRDSMHSPRSFNDAIKKNRGIQDGIERYRDLYDWLGGRSLKEMRAKPPKKIPDNLKPVWNVLKKYTYTEVWQCNGRDFINSLLGTDSDAESTVDKKFRLVKDFGKYSDRIKGRGYSFALPDEIIGRIARDYLYFKKIRNEINHASDNENFSETQKAYYHGQGFEDTITVGGIIKDMKNSVRYIQDADESQKKQQQ